MLRKRLGCHHFHPGTIQAGTTWMASCNTESWLVSTERVQDECLVSFPDERPELPLA
jgi:hypothetical protein